ncbi:hypothetical protein [Mucilaginibacter sp. FT3.2]|uniref:hypothetical protein n=1 Tax=Mucilaginibacter sp. FT3.2 TaxID=2723090 RepID=UPI001621A107|nr:hypothetical protein [Mucilaginibacter sp. FT3.2]MBB6234221.1 hypothetical protein [Mucilaginibacter sp. FT3.2]
MGTIENGIKIQCAGNLLDRTEISAGTERALGYSPAGIPFRTGAYKPKKPWRQLTDREAEVLMLKNKTNHTDYSSTVTILSLPEILKDKLSQLELHRVLSKYYFTKYYSKRESDFQNATRLLHLYFSSFNVSEREILASFFAVNNPNLETTTKYFEGRQYVGLHIDNWENATIEGAHLAQNRVCINLGLQTRYLLFVNQPLNNIKSRIVEKEGDFHLENTQWHLGQRFFKHYQSYPVVKIAIHPFEAYIAPTENMLHDGSTIQATKPDITFTLRGYFSV